jgi:hypothetical protein
MQNLCALLIGLTICNLASCTDDTEPGSGNELQELHQGVLAGTWTLGRENITGFVQVKIFVDEDAGDDESATVVSAQIEGLDSITLIGENKEGAIELSKGPWVFTVEMGVDNFRGSFEHVDADSEIDAEGVLIGLLDRENKSQIFLGEYLGDYHGAMNLVTLGDEVLGVFHGDMIAEAQGSLVDNALTLQFDGTAGLLEVSGTASGTLADGSDLEGTWSAVDSEENPHAGTHVQEVTHSSLCAYHICDQPCDEEEVCVEEFGGCVKDFLKNFGVKGQCAYAPRLMDMFHCPSEDMEVACGATENYCFCHPGCGVELSCTDIFENPTSLGDCEADLLSAACAEFGPARCSGTYHSNGGTLEKSLACICTEAASLEPCCSQAESAIQGYEWYMEPSLQRETGLEHFCRLPCWWQAGDDWEHCAGIRRELEACKEQVYSNYAFENYLSACGLEYCELHPNEEDCFCLLYPDDPEC